MGRRAKAGRKQEQTHSVSPPFRAGERPWTRGPVCGPLRDHRERRSQRLKDPPPNATGGDATGDPERAGREASCHQSSDGDPVVGGDPGSCAGPLGPSPPDPRGPAIVDEGPGDPRGGSRDRWTVPAQEGPVDLHHQAVVRACDGRRGRHHAWVETPGYDDRLPVDRIAAAAMDAPLSPTLIEDRPVQGGGELIVGSPAEADASEPRVAEQEPPIDAPREPEPFITGHPDHVDRCIRPIRETHDRELRGHCVRHRGTQRTRLDTDG